MVVNPYSLDGRMMSAEEIARVIPHIHDWRTVDRRGAVMTCAVCKICGQTRIKWTPDEPLFTKE